MPFKLTKHQTGDFYQVVDVDTGKVVAEVEDKKEAKEILKRKEAHERGKSSGKSDSDLVKDVEHLGKRLADIDREMENLRQKKKKLQQVQVQIVDQLLPDNFRLYLLQKLRRDKKKLKTKVCLF